MLNSPYKPNDYRAIREMAIARGFRSVSDLIRAYDKLKEEADHLEKGLSIPNEDNKNV